ncbi:MAG: outer membrane porin, OprD family [Lewinellaceae bacterium]|nr:outer membrane porin, OprD family [Lewinellaceae bacterium]
MELSISYALRMAATAGLLAALPSRLTAQQADTLPARNLSEAFKKGSFGGHFRSFFMATDNARQLSDYYAWAAGGAFSFQTASLHGFSIGAEASFAFNLSSSDLAARDSSTGAANRYEIGLFDLQEPENRRDLRRLEALWLRYERKNLKATLGRQALQTPFINKQDGRMNPSAEEGLWLEARPGKRLSLEGGWLWRMAPRSTFRWVKVEESFGLYPRGLNADGTPAGYAGHVSSSGIGLLGIRWNPGRRTKLQLWEQMVDRVFNTVFLQVEHNIPLRNGHRLQLGLQALRQDALADGGNADPALAYFKKDGHSHAFSAEIGWKRGAWQAAAAYTHITSEGRYLAPREWGRDPFFTFMPRERMEGSGNSHAATLQLGWQPRGGKFRSEITYGHFYLPELTDFTLNKYAFPSYRQLNLDLRYTLSGWLKGLQAHALLVYKGRMGETYGNDKFVINKVDMLQYDLILNYRF